MRRISTGFPKGDTSSMPNHSFLSTLWLPPSSCTELIHLTLWIKCGVMSSEVSQAASSILCSLSIVGMIHTLIVSPRAKGLRAKANTDLFDVLCGRFFCLVMYGKLHQYHFCVVLKNIYTNMRTHISMLYSLMKFECHHKESANFFTSGSGSFHFTLASNFWTIFSEERYCSVFVHSFSILVNATDASHEPTHQVFYILICFQ